MITKINQFNENILVPRNIERRQNKLKQDAIKLLEQETIDGDFSLEKYMLDIPEDSIKVKVINGTFYCDNCNLTEFPKWFERLIINHAFICSYNKLTSLEGGPQTVNGTFYCDNNNLTTLKGCLKTINSNFSCHRNKLISLEGGPQTVNGTFNCSFNKLTSLEYCPQIVKGDFYCYDNKVKLKKPENCKITGYFGNI